ncbi:MAG: DUF47 domain-containing protein [Chloroflexi bacterium]|nr:DUF47 domain-containing protein [Chloroflexota bacterium]
MNISLIPREAKFFDLLKDGVENVHAASLKLLDLMEDYTNLPIKVEAIIQLESRGDFIIHEIMRQLYRTFVTPIDREDIATLAERFDDVVDCIEEAARLMLDYKLVKPTEKAVEMTRLVVRCSEEMKKAMSLLHHRGAKLQEMLPRIVAVNQAENEADLLLRMALAELFNNGTDPIEIMKWREVYSQLENACDRCEDAANVMEGVVLKNA